MRTLRFIALPLVLTLACTPDPQLRLKLLQGADGFDPLFDPGNTQVGSSAVGSLALRWSVQTDAGLVVANLGEMKPSVQTYLPMPTREATLPGRLVVRAIRADVNGAKQENGGLVSVAKSTPVTPVPGKELTVYAFLGRRETFTPLKTTLPETVLNPAVARLGDTGALMVGGSTSNPDQPVAAALARYRIEFADVCTNECLTGDLPPPRVEAIAVTLRDGSVLHGLGRDATGTPLADLYVTSPSGNTMLLTGTTALTGRSEAAAALNEDGDVLIFGGLMAGGMVSNEVWRVRLADGLENVMVTRLPKAMVLPRRLAGLATTPLSRQSYVLVGGFTSGAVATASVEVFTEAGGSRSAIESTPFRKDMLTPRVRPSVIAMNDDNVFIIGGGSGVPEVFWSTPLDPGGLTDVAPAPSAPTNYPTAAAAKLENGGIIIAGGEAPSAMPQILRFQRAINGDPGQYQGTWRTDLTASQTLHIGGRLVTLADDSILMVGGSNSVEIFVAP